MHDQFQKFFEPAKALITYVATEQVFDKSADMGCGGFDTYQSEFFYDLIAKAMKALTDFESTMKRSECFVAGKQRSIYGDRGNLL